MTNKDRADRLSRSRRARGEEEPTTNERQQDAAENRDTGADSGVKERTAVIMYLPEDLADELDIRFDELNAQHKREHGEKLEKNRDFYPAVVQNGLDGEGIKDILDA